MAKALHRVSHLSRPPTTSIRRQSLGSPSFHNARLRWLSQNVKHHVGPQHAPWSRLVLFPFLKNGRHQLIQSLRLSSPATHCVPVFLGASSIIALLARDSSVSPLASGASSIPMVWYSNGHDPHTGVDVGDALPWVGRGPEHDATIDSQQSTSMQWLSRALSARSIYGPPLIALAAKARQAGQVLVVRPDAEETYTSAFGKSREKGNRFTNVPMAGEETQGGMVTRWASRMDKDGRDRSSVSSSSVRISPAPPTRSLRPSHFYFDLTASLVTRRRTLVLLYTHSGTEERRETDGPDGRTRKVRVVTIGHCVRDIFPQSDPNLAPPCQTKRQIKTLPPSRRTWAVTSQKFETSRFDKRRLYTLLKAPIHFCPNKTPVNLGDDFIRGGYALSSAFFISASELAYLSPLGELYFPEPAAYTLGMMIRNEPADFRAVGTPLAHTLVHLPNEYLAPDMQKTETRTCQNGGINVYEARGSTDRDLAIREVPPTPPPSTSLQFSPTLSPILWYGSASSTIPVRR
ncbi:hypothetical protein EDB89DRAFT_1903149 [Lactarius sanguifluus]|nr:hypothetical protein EDB89DRAFT_1903149 [Lactarius sanguifluus]